MNFTMPIFSVAMPEIFLLCITCLTLLVDVCIKDRESIWTYVLVQVALISTFILVLTQYREYPDPIVTFSGHYILDKLAVLVKLFVLVSSSFAFVYARKYLKVHKIDRGEYYLVGLFSVLGMLIMASASSFLSIYLGLELLSLALYALVALNKNSQDAIEAAMKYFVLGSFASGILLYGISMVYGALGSIQLSVIPTLIATASHASNYVVLFGLIFILCGVIFKFGAVPFHMWVPDVYAGAAAPTTLFIASAPKIAAFAIMMRILVEAFPALHVPWEQFLMVIAVLSMFFGNLLAIAQTNIKRMLAYSSIAHIGYMLLGIIAGPGSSQGYSAALFYIATYVLAAAGAFAIIGFMSKGNGIDLDQLDDYRGLNVRNPWLAFMMLLLMFSMAGVPPAVGFFAKLGLIEALVEAHYVWLAVIAMLCAIIGAYYYLRVVMYMYFEEPRETLLEDSHIHVPGVILTAISVNSASVLVLGLFPSSLIDLCRISVS